MSDKTLTRGQLLRVLTRGTNEPAAVAQIEAALARLGWAAKDRFERADMLAIAEALGAQGRDRLVAEGPEARPLVAIVDPLLGALDTARRQL